jgi:hypothetical protein
MRAGGHPKPGDILTPLQTSALTSLAKGSLCGFKGGPKTHQGKNLRLITHLIWPDIGAPQGLLVPNVGINIRQM